MAIKFNHYFRNQAAEFCSVYPGSNAEGKIIVKIFITSLMVLLLAACGQDQAPVDDHGNTAAVNRCRGRSPVRSRHRETKPAFRSIASPTFRSCAYEVPGFDQLPLQQKKLAYFLSQAALAGRDICLRPELRVQPANSKIVVCGRGFLRR